MFYVHYLESPSEPILRDVFNGWSTGNGIFSYLAGQAALPWSEDSTVDSTSLDLAYFGNHSGGKFCSPLVKHLLNDSGEVSAESRVALAKVITSQLLPKWQGLWDTYNATYDPTHNYDMHEVRDLTTTEDEEKVTDGTLVQSGTNSTEHGMVETTQHGKTNDAMEYQYGLNTATASPKPSDKTEMVEGGSTVVTDSGTDTQRRNLQDKNDVTETIDNDGTEHETTHRYGNIGVTTTQQLLQEERKLWEWEYFKAIFKDLDSQLALPFFDSCRV